ncbi:MAG: hypothetical protein JEZ05_00345 [Tenericutes bacterium]|nr:hypothetical protein [Mycoplasmatota bacterium]
MRKLLLSIIAIMSVIVLIGCNNGEVTLKDYKSVFVDAGYTVDKDKDMTFILAASEAEDVIRLYKDDDEIYIYEFESKEAFESSIIKGADATYDRFAMGCDDETMIELFNEVSNSK